MKHIKRIIITIATILLCTVQVEAYNYELTGTINGTTYYFGVNSEGSLKTYKTKTADANFTWVCITDADTYGAGRLLPDNS